MTKTTPAPRVRALNLYTVESNGQPVAQAMAISQAEAVRLYVESVQQPTMTARLSSPLEARTLAGLPLLQREPVATDTKTADLFEGVPAADHAEEVLAMAPEAAAADHVGDAAEMVDPLAAGGFAPCGRALGACGKATQTCGREGCGVEVVEMPPQHAPIAAVLEGLASGAQESAAEQTGEPAGCLDAAPTAGESAGASSASDDDGGRELAAAEQAAYEAQGAARFAQHHGSELKRQAAQAAVRRAMGGKPVAMYLDPATGQTWSGRGLRPKWLLAAIEAGRTQDEFLIDTRGAQA